MKGWNLQSKRKGFRPLALGDKFIYGYHKGSIVRADFELQEIDWLYRLPQVNKWISLVGDFRIVDRILRLSPSTGLIHDNNFFVVRRSDIYRYDISKKCLFKEFTIPAGRRALSLSEMVLETGEKTIVFGEYFDNPNRDSVNIWGRQPGSGAWRKLATIPEGEIEHIHSVKQIQDDIWILTGDFEEAAGIWKSSNYLSTIRPIFRGRQQFRGAWIATLQGRIYYATDTQMERNHIYEIAGLDHDRPDIHTCGTLEGSSIYDAQGVERQYFSTTVESGPPSGNFVLDMLDIRRGPGILSKTAHIMSIGSTGEIEIIYSANKDFLPFRLAQFGTFTFPSGTHPSNTVVAYGIGLQGCDDTCLILKRD
jgi:hypothetical protein